jgi:hypothetical protein
MALPAPLADFPDQLTRTVLVLDPEASPSKLLHVKRKLQDVPGVLLADVSAQPNRASIAHDEGVPFTAFLDAVRSVGVAIVEPQKERAATSPTVASAAGLRSMVTVVLVAFFSFAFANLINRLNPTNHWVNSALLFAMCILITMLGVSSRRAR